MTRLDTIALTIEIVLISLLQTAALIFLAQKSVPLLHSDLWSMYVPYIFAGLIILLLFWSQSILHAISFVRWPLRMEHMLLYFLATFVQMIAVNEIDDIALWFRWWIFFFSIVLILYLVDLWMLRSIKPTLLKQNGGEEFSRVAERRHLLEIAYLIPAGLVFCIVAWFITIVFPLLFSKQIGYAIPGIVQSLVLIGALYFSLRNFRERTEMMVRLFDRKD